MTTEAISDFINLYLFWAPSETQLFILVIGAAIVAFLAIKVFKLHLVWLIFLLVILVPMLPLIEYWWGMLVRALGFGE